MSLWTGSSRSSIRWISSPAFRNASSRSRSVRCSRLNSVVSVKISGSGQKRIVVPCFVRGLALRQLAGRPTPRVLLVPREAVAQDVGRHLRGERVHDRDAHAVQAAGDRVAAAAELAAGVQRRERDLDGGTAVLRPRDRLDGDAGAVVLHGHAAVGVERDDDLGRAARHRLVDGVVDDLGHEVMQASGTGGADVHPRAEPDVLDALEDLDVAGVVVLRSGLLLGGALRRYGCHGPPILPTQRPRPDREAAPGNCLARMRTSYQSRATNEPCFAGCFRPSTCCFAPRSEPFR